jgi:hypothetical protein
LALMQLYVFACELLQHRSYPNLERTLRDLKAVPLMRSIWAVGTSLSAGELKRALRAVVGEYDRSSSLKDGKRRPCCWPGCAHR